MSLCLSVCLYVCMSVCLYVCMYTFLYVCMYRHHKEMSTWQPNVGGPLQLLLSKLSILTLELGLRAQADAQLIIINIIINNNLIITIDINMVIITI